MRLVLFLVLYVTYVSHLHGDGISYSFSKDIQPILTEKCARCHGGVRKKAGLSFLSFQSATKQLKSGSYAIVPGDKDASELVRRIYASDPDVRMPPDESISVNEKKALEQWIESGALWESHWSFVPASEVYPASDGHPIDVLVEEKLGARGWTLSPEADKETLIRRLYLDLIGLNPEWSELHELIENWKEDSYEELVDSLLASPHFGERWGRYWLDKARYADSDGYEKDRPRPNAWRYREWLIHAINEDMPFDQFSKWQIAGDIIYHSLSEPERDPEMLVASAFHRQTLFNTEGGTDPEEDRVKRVVDRVSTTAQIWTGMTIGCAQCHDHPYDPVSQKEFYQYFAFFNSDTEPKIKVSVAYNDPKNSKSMDTDIMGLLPLEKSRKTFIFHRGDFLQPKHELGTVEASTPAIYGENGNENTNRNRLDLANQLMSADNPLTSRVVVNSIWQKLFGRGIMPTLDDWGVRGEKPQHFKLLDWLSHEFPRNGWSRKKLIRTIVLSRVYKQSSHARPEYEAVDPNNDLLFRQNRVRLDAEIIRDLFIQTGGLLDRRIGGPSVFPHLPPDVAAQSYANNFSWKTSQNGNQYRRGIYTFFKRTAPHPNLILFDCTDSNATLSQRMISNTPLQALATLQNEVFMEASRHFGHKLKDHFSQSRNVRNTIHFAYQSALSKTPTKYISDILSELHTKSEIYYLENRQEANKVVGKFWKRENENESYKLASWIIVARSIMNLDEFINRN